MVTIILAVSLALAGFLQVALLYFTDPSFPTYMVPFFVYYFGALPAMILLSLPLEFLLRRAGKEVFLPVVSGVVHAGLHLVVCCILMSQHFPYYVFLSVLGLGLLFSVLSALLHLEDEYVPVTANLDELEIPVPQPQPVQIVRVGPAPVRISELSKQQPPTAPKVEKPKVRRP